MVPQTSKFTTAWCLASNSTNMPLAMKCWIKNRKSRASQKQHKKKLQSHVCRWPKSFVNWLTSWANQKELQSTESFNWNTFAWAFGLSTIHAIKTIEETTPTHTLGMPLHDCMHPSCCLLMCVFFGKKAEVLLSDWAWQTAGFFLVHRIPGAIYVGLKCTDRSRWSLATVTSGHSHGWTQPWSHRNCGISAITSLPLSDVLSLIGYLGQNYPCKHCVSLLVCRTDMSLQSQEPQLQSVVRNGALA